MLLLKTIVLLGGLQGLACLNLYADIPRWISLTIYLGLAHLIPYELPKIGDELIDRFDWYPLYIPMVAIIYFLGAKGYFISTGRPKQPMPNTPDKKSAPQSIPEEKLGRVIQALRKWPTNAGSIHFLPFSAHSKRSRG